MIPLRLNGLRRDQRPRHRLGVSLIEVVVVAAVGSIIFLLIIRWLLTLAAVSTTTINNATAGRSSAYIDSRLSADITAATGCDSLDASPIVHLDPLELALFTTGPRSDGTTGLKLVTWKQQSGSILRSEVAINPATDGCNVRSSAAGNIIAANSTTSTLFTSLVSNVDAGDCTELNGVPQGTGCNPDALAITTTLYPTASDSGAVSFNRTYALPRTDGGGR